MTKVQINPGICGFISSVSAESENGQDVKLSIHSGCPSIKKMIEGMEESYDAYELCLTKPGEGPLYEYARENFPVHASCPVISGILKCAEVECNLALPKDCEIKFLDKDE